MKFSKFQHQGAEVKYSVFKPAKESAGEICALAIPEGRGFEAQLKQAAGAVSSFIASPAAAAYSAAFIRIYLSDAANQAQSAISAIQAIAPEAAVSCVQQPPFPFLKIAALILMQENAKVEKIDSCTSSVSRNGHTQYYTASAASPIHDTYAETASQLSYLEGMLASRGLSLAANCVRTWFFVQNIDVNYAALVKARNSKFSSSGLTSSTHYIASTGICGRHASKDVTSIMDAYSADALSPSQMGYLYAPAFMNRTSDYGVAFERGTYIDYADRRHVIISGTASINSKGDIVAEGNIKAQAMRMIQNVEALLDEAGAAFGDISHIICYLRDPADYPDVSEIMNNMFPDVPLLITLAPVCRPGWLIEMECMASAERKSGFRKF